MDKSQTIEDNDQPVAVLLPKAKAYAMLKLENIPHKEICETLGITSKYGYKLSSSVKKAGEIVSKFSLSSDKMQSKAHKAIDKLMQGKPFGTIDKVKDSTALAAASMVYDRTDPVIKKNMNLNINATVDPLDLSAYLSK